VSYNAKHNEANGEDNRDGKDDNHSWNCGVEGPSADAAIRTLRAQQKRNLIASLLLSQGVPMLLGGDECGRTQHGNNNAYCQDNETSWLNWDWSAEEQEFLAFVERMVALRRAHPVFARRRFLQGRTVAGDSVKEIAWLSPSGAEMTPPEWDQPFARALGVYLAGSAIERVDRRGRPIKDDDFLLLFNAHYEAVPFVLPRFRDGYRWVRVLDTAAVPAVEVGTRLAPGASYPLQGRSLALLTELTRE
jgi:glycogen operon protein